MGASNSMECTLKQEELSQFVQSSKFTADEVKALWFHFKTINESQEHINRRYTIPFPYLIN